MVPITSLCYQEFIVAWQATWLLGLLKSRVESLLCTKSQEFYTETSIVCSELELE